MEEIYGRHQVLAHEELKLIGKKYIFRGIDGGREIGILENVLGNYPDIDIIVRRDDELIKYSFVYNGGLKRI